MAIVKNSNSQHAREFWAHVEHVASRLEIERTRTNDAIRNDITNGERFRSTSQTVTDHTQIAKSRDQSE